MGIGRLVVKREGIGGKAENCAQGTKLGTGDKTRHRGRKAGLSLIGVAEKDTYLLWQKKVLALAEKIDMYPVAENHVLLAVEKIRT